MVAKYKFYIKVSDESGVVIQEFRRSDGDLENPLHEHLSYDIAAILDSSFPRPMLILAKAILAVCESSEASDFAGDEQLYEAAQKCSEFWEKSDKVLDAIIAKATKATNSRE